MVADNRVSRGVARASDPPSLSKVVALTDKPQEGRDKNQR